MQFSRRLIAAAFASGLVVCRRKGARVIAVVPMGRSHLFWQSIHAGAVAASWETGVEIIWNGPAAETDYNGQIQIVDAMINRRVDAIALAPIDRKVMIGVVERAARAGIPVIIFDSPVDTDKCTAEVATDNYGAGRMAAERMGRILNGNGEVVIVAGQPGSASNLAREQGFEDKIRESYPRIRILDKRYGMADFANSLKVAENMLTAHPALDGIFASNEPASVGAALAVKSRPGKVRIVGFDWSPNLLEDLQAGVIDSLVAQHPFQIGYESVMLALKKLEGKPVAKVNKMAPRLVTRENMNDPDVLLQVRPDLNKYLGPTL